jgi:hypothetical protein
MALTHILVCIRPLNIIRNLDTKSANNDKGVTRNGDSLECMFNCLHLICVAWGMHVDQTSVGYTDTPLH